MPSISVPIKPEAIRRVRRRIEGSAEIPPGEDEDELFTGTYTWRLTNVSKLQKVYSNPVEVGTYTWRMLAYPKGNKKQSLALYLDAPEASMLPASISPKAIFHITVVNQLDASKNWSKGTQHTFVKDEPDWGFTETLPLQEVWNKQAGFIVNDTLEVQVKVQVLRDGVYKPDSDALTQAAAEGNEVLCQVLLRQLQHTADADAQLTSALCSAARHGHMRVCQLLLGQSQHRAEAAADDCSPLMAAAEGGYQGVCSLLLGQPGMSANAQDSEALVRAAARGHDSICRLLMEYPVNPARADAQDSEALVVAARNGHYSTVVLLLNAKVHPASAHAQHSKALVEAARKARYKMVELLVKHGA